MTSARTGRNRQFTSAHLSRLYKRGFRPPRCYSHAVKNGSALPSMDDTTTLNQPASATHKIWSIRLVGPGHMKPLPPLQ